MYMREIRSTFTLKAEFDVDHYLRLPRNFLAATMFCRYESVILHNGNKTWCVNGEYFDYPTSMLMDGWTYVVRDLHITTGKYLKFEPRTAGEFNLDVYTGEEDGFVPNSHLCSYHGRPYTEHRCNYPDPQSSASWPTFTVTLTKRHTLDSPTPWVSVRFIKDNGLADLDFVVLRDPEGRKFAVSTTLYGKGNQKQNCRWGAGWGDFYRSSGLKVGQRVRFILVDRVVWNGKPKAVFEVSLLMMFEFYSDVDYYPGLFAIPSLNTVLNLLCHVLLCVCPWL